MKIAGNPVTTLALVSSLVAVSAAYAAGQSTCASPHAGDFIPNDVVPADSAGLRLAMNASGTRLVVGTAAHRHNGVNTGGAWVVSHPGTIHQSEVELRPSAVIADLRFATSLAISSLGDVIVVGAPGQTSGPAAMWSRTIVFRFDGMSWAEEWLASGLVADSFGHTVAVSAAGDVFAVGAPNRDISTQANDNVGAVEIYRRQAGTWAFEAVLSPSDSASFDAFGNFMTMAADGNMLAIHGRGLGIGPPNAHNGAIYIFERTGTIWTEVDKLLAPVAYSVSTFGAAGLALDGPARTLAVGDIFDSRLTTLQGAVTVFRKGAAGWVFSADVLPSTSFIGGGFGRSVAMNAAGDKLWVGSQGHQTGGGTGGGVEEFALTVNGWQSVGVHVAPSPEHGAGFGYSLAVSSTGRRWITGEPWSDAYGVDAGRVHVFDSTCADPFVYCTSQTNSIGCVPQIGVAGSASMSSAKSFMIRVTKARNQQSGMLLYGTNGRSALPWQGGTLCVQPPLRRTPLVASGGTALPALDCSGVLARDFNDWVRTSADPELFPGQHVRAQFYARDPAAPSQVNLSDAVEFYLEP